MSPRALYWDLFILFVIYNNDIDLDLNSFISKFSVKKIGNAVFSKCGRQSVQEDLQKLPDRSIEWEMPFSINKCQILQLGSRNMKKDKEM